MSNSEDNIRDSLEELSIEELYKKYKIYKITINETDDPKIKDDNKLIIQEIKKILDDKELDENLSRNASYYD